MICVGVGCDVCRGYVDVEKLCVIRYFWRSCLYVELYVEKLYVICGEGISARRSNTYFRRSCM